MKALRHRLPPPNALVVFEAVARRLSFTAAARELGVSQAATSRQIANLEGHLAVALFRRENRRVALTAAGAELQAAVDLGLNHIANTAEGLSRRGDEGGLRVATTIAFSAYWLMPRLVGFHTAHPGFELDLITTDSPRDWEAEGVALAVQFGGAAAIPGYRQERLFGDEILAVARPGYFDGRPEPVEPADLLGETLLQMESELPMWTDWPAWLERCGVTVPRGGSGRLPGPHFTTYTITIQAALDGRGIALGWRRLLAPALAEGRLVPVTAARVVPDDSYVLLTRESALEEPPGGPSGVAAFRTWLLDEAAADWT